MHSLNYLLEDALYRLMLMYKNKALKSGEKEFSFVFPLHKQPWFDDLNVPNISAEQLANSVMERPEVKMTTLSFVKYSKNNGKFYFSFGKTK